MHRILLVDDDPDINEANAVYLGLTYDVRTAASGAKALGEIARMGGFDCIVLDVGLPDMDGFKLCKQIRDFSDTPIRACLKMHNGEYQANQIMMQPS